MKELPICSYKQSLSLWAIIAKPTKPLTLTLMVNGLILASFGQSYGVTLRHDLQPAIHKMICGHKLIPNHSRLWQQGIFDTMFEGQVLAAGPKSKLNHNSLARAARSLARSKGHSGALYGRCSAQKAWVVAVASPKAFIKTNAQQLDLAIGQTLNHCRYARVDFAPAGLGRPSKLWSSRDQSPEPLRSIQINSRFLGPGTVSLTCRRKYKKSSNELWALVPINNPDTAPPYQNLLNKQPSSLADWVNALRVVHGLTALKNGLSPLDQTGQRLMKKTTVKHDKSFLSREKARLKKLDIVFLGENRVHGQSPKDMAWLLWNSPRHRSLLLNSKATHFAHAHRRLTPQKYLSVLVLANSEPKPR